MEKDCIEFGGEPIEFTVTRKNVKNVILRVNADATISVSARDNVPMGFIKEFVKKKAFWIQQKREYFLESQTNTIKLNYESGESIKYLGRQYRLKICKAEDGIECVKYQQGFIYIYAKDISNTERKRDLFQKWLRNRADIVFNESLERMYKYLGKYGISKPKLMIKTMKARWGSCVIDKNTVIINFELIKAPRYCIDYVVLHELIHFKFRNHDKDFYSFLTALMPDWKTRKTILDEEFVRDL